MSTQICLGSVPERRSEIHIQSSSDDALDNRIVIARQTAALWFLGTRMNLLHRIPTAARTMAHMKQFPNQLGIRSNVRFYSA